MRTVPNCTILESSLISNGKGQQGVVTRRSDKQRLTARDRREQLLSAASTQFAKNGLHATTTATLAAAAGVSEPTLYAHFADKEALFQEVVRRNSEARVHALQRRMSSIIARKPRECIEAMLEATVLVCLSADGGPLVTNWALLELHEFGADLHRQEIGFISTMCDEEFATRFPNERRIPTLTAYLISFAIQACYSYGLWLGTMRHTSQTAGPLVRQFAASAADSALALIRTSRRQLGR
jgi:AcrR family transcriptional regulator